MSDNERSYKKKDFVSDQEVRWCPGCGDYSILASMQMAMTKIGKKKEDIVCVSGIGCSSRFPYYLNTFGYHTIHGRAPAFATGIKLANPELSVWVITGDGDGLSIGGNHLIHAMRRNVDFNIIMFNNEIYGLTKGQYSPTSMPGKVTKSSPYGSIDRPFTPAKIALGASCTFIARYMDKDPKGMGDLFLAAEQHRGTSFVEIHQNCVIFNDATHDAYTHRSYKDDNSIFVIDGAPMIFGKERNKGIYLDKLGLKVGVIGEDLNEKDVLIHDSKNAILAHMLIESSHPPAFPMVYGIIFQNSTADTYDHGVEEQVQKVKDKSPDASVKKLIYSGNIWDVK